MAALQIYFNDALQREVTLYEGNTSLGRRKSNDIVIDNIGVSGKHARIINKDGKLFVEDLKSTNGTFVNGSQVEKMVLEEGDVIAICKHNLKLVNLDTQNDKINWGKDDTDNAEAAPPDSTMMFGASRVEAMLHNQRVAKSVEKGKAKARLVVTTNDGRQQTYVVSKTNFRLGKGSEVDFEVGGWFAPRLAAIVNHKKDGFYLLPQKRGKVKINGRVIKKTEKLKDSDTIQVRNLTMKFYITIVQQ